MATKFFKNWFGSSSDKPKNAQKKSEESEKAEKSDNLPYDTRRKLSISRSGRMRQNNKKRHSLTDDLFGEDSKKTDKKPAIEYHVHGKKFFSESNDNNNGVKLDLNKDNDDKEETTLSHSKSLDSLKDKIEIADTIRAASTEDANLQIEKAFKQLETML